jgi:hypothetical protein
VRVGDVGYSLRNDAQVGRGFPVGGAFWLVMCMLLLPMELCGRLPWARRTVSLATGLDPVACIGAGADVFVLKRNAGGGIDDGAGVGGKGRVA